MVKFPKLTASGGTCKGSHQSSAAVFTGMAMHQAWVQRKLEEGRGREFVERKKVLESPSSDLETVHSER